MLVEPDLEIVSTSRLAGLAVACVAQFMVVLDASIVSVALPSIDGALGFGGSSLSLVMSAYALAFGALLLVGGRLADLVGRRRLFMTGVAVFSIASLWAGLAWSPAALVAARTLQGMAAAALAPAALAMVADLFPAPPRRNWALAVWGAVSACGGAAGLVIGGVLTELAGWRWTFLVNVPIGALLVVAAPRVLPLAERVAGSVDAFAALQVVVGLTLVFGGMTVVEQRGWSDRMSIASSATGVAVLAWFARGQRRAAEPLVAAVVATSRTVRVGNVAAFLVAATIAAQSFFGSLYLQAQLGMSPMQAGVASLPVTLSALAGSWSASRMLARWRGGVVLVAAQAGIASGLASLAFATADGPYATDVLPAFVVFGASLGVAFVAVTVLATVSVPSVAQGSASGLLNTSQQLGFAFGLAALSAVAASQTAPPDGWRLAFAVAAAASAGGAALTWAATRRTRPDLQRARRPEAVSPFDTTAGR